MNITEIITLVALFLCGGYFFGRCDAEEFEHKQLTGVFALLLGLALITAIILITLRVTNYYH